MNTRGAAGPGNLGNGHDDGGSMQLQPVSVGGVEWRPYRCEFHPSSRRQPCTVYARSAAHAVELIGGHSAWLVGEPKPLEAEREQAAEV